MRRFVAPKNRLESFSDGVFAIIITLLVFEIKIPDLQVPQSSWEAARVFVRLLPNFFGFLMSFALVAILWVQHHYIFYFVQKVSWGLIFVNKVFLCCLCLVVMPSAFIGEHPWNAVGLAVFSGFFALAGIILQLLWIYAYRFKLFYMCVTYEKLLPYLGKRFLGIVLLLSAMALAFVHPLLTWGILCLVLLYYTIPKWIYLVEEHELPLE